MWIFDIFSKEKKIAQKNINYIKNLVVVALSDWNLDEMELKVLNMIAWKLWISENSLIDIIKNHRNIKCILPKDKKDRINQLWDIILIILADNKIEEKEIKIIQDFAYNLEIRPGITTWIIRNLEEIDLLNNWLSDFKSTFLSFFSDDTAFFNN